MMIFPHKLTSHSDGLRILKRYASSKKQSKFTIYSHTIRLPSTNFPLWVKKEERVNYDEKIEKDSDFQGLYNWQRNNSPGTEFVLHDGPPYANGPAHIGHALNKDIVIRQNLLKGHKIHYKPGWDCHGLPIELKTLSVIEQKEENIPALEIRTRARKFASSAIEQQKNVFKTWGILANWDTNCYYTYDKSYVKNQINQFYNLYKKKVIYRDLKPVYWSPSSKTALAEAELEYNKNHVSKAITIRLPINAKKLPEFYNTWKNERIFALVWTTTPWTLPANKAIAYSENLTYSFIKIDENNDIYLINTDLILSFEKLMNKPAVVLCTLPGKDLSALEYEHPFEKKSFPFIPGTHVSSSKGTGLVHIAPAHGPDDFVLGLKHKLAMNCVVDQLGCYTEEAGEKLKGLDVLENGNNLIIEILKENVLYTESFEHSYPYDWRTKKPVIIRASEQWFIDTDCLKMEAFKCLKNVTILPKQNSLRLSSLLETRPFWCISRQRMWGVPIPVLYDKNTFSPIIDENFIKHYCHLIDVHGTDFWWKFPVKELIPPDSSYSKDDIVKKEDILDIWFDSGISWSNALDKDQVADMYLEGIDQCTGWFQSSLLTSVGLRNIAPYKNLFIHGFAVDEKGYKMSKSLGNVVDPQDVIRGKDKQPAYGIDVLRWWVASHAVQHNQIPVTKNTFKNSQENVQKLRLIIKYLLGALESYNFTDAQKLFWILDKYMLHKVFMFHDEINALFEDMQLHKVTALVLNFVANEISSKYLLLTKDRLYCEAEDSPSRMACQYVCFIILETILRSIAPVVPHLVEEANSYHPVFKTQSYFRRIRPQPLKNWDAPDIELPQLFFKIKEEVNYLKPPKMKLSQLDIDIQLSKPICETLAAYSEFEILEILQVASFKTYVGEKNFKVVDVKETKNHICERCRKFACSTDQKLCSRCSSVINDKSLLSCCS